MGRAIDYNKIDIEQLDEIETENFEKIRHKKKFDDGTVSTKTGRKKQTVQRGGKDEVLEEKEESER